MHNKIGETPLKHDVEYCVRLVDVKPAAEPATTISSNAKASKVKGEEENSPGTTIASTSNTSVDSQAASQQLSKNAKKKKRKKNNKAAAAAAMATNSASSSSTSLAGVDEVQHNTTGGATINQQRRNVQENSSPAESEPLNHKDVAATQQQNEMLEKEVTQIINELQELTKSKVLLHKVFFLKIFFFTLKGYLVILVIFSLHICL